MKMFILHVDKFVLYPTNFYYNEKSDNILGLETIKEA